jgi:predicted metalloprotease with PDZ domain
LLTGWQADASDSGDQPIQYLVTFADADRHIIDIEAEIPTSGADAVQLMMPVWTPGSYLVREYARNIESVSAVDPVTSQPLSVTKSAKNRWTVTPAEGARSIRFIYRLYCREMSVRTNWVEHDFGVLTGAATFVTAVDMLDHPHRVRLVLPTQWSQSVTALKSVGPQPHTYQADTFDTLVDSPIALGNPQISTFTVSDRPHLLVTLNDAGLWDNDRAAEDVKRIVQTQHDFWGSVPYEKYIFFNIVGESGGGLEHDNGTLLMTSRWTFGDPERYRGWLGLVSHEFFHTWNVRRLRPRVLVSYDYEAENYFNELWIAEGVTSYYDDLLQVRSGLLSESDYLKRLSGTLARVQEAPGNRVQSLADSSFDAWIKHYRPDENDVNSRISYYTKGSLVAWLLDTKIRIATENEKSLDDVMRMLYERHALDRGGYDLTDFRKIVDEVAGERLSEWLESVVDRTEPLDFSPVVDWYGLRLGSPVEGDDAEPDEEQGAKPSDAAPETDTDPKQDAPKQDAPKKDAKRIADAAPASGQESTENSTQPSADKVALAEAATAKKSEAPYLGASVRDQGGKLIVTEIVRGGPADLAGWNVDDELLAVGDFRASENLIREHLGQLGIEKPIESMLARRGQLIQRPITLEPHRPDRWKLATAKKATDQQLERRRQWLDQPK